MKFKDLYIGQRFCFASELAWYSRGMAKEPWIKISPRKYRPDVNPFSGDLHERQDAEFWANRHNTVGSVNTEVILRISQD